MIELTVLIPTYNRKVELTKTLLMLQAQKNQEFKVVLSDNSSDYSIENEIFPQLVPSFFQRITVIHNQRNIGADSNIAQLFQLCDTKWGWLLGDDDIVSEDAIDTIQSTIAENNSVGCIWFTLADVDYDEIHVNNMQKFVLCNEKIHSYGDTVFLSNKVYDMEEAVKYLYVTYRYSYTCVSQCIPMFEMLKRGKELLIVRGKQVVRHAGFKNGVTWDVSKVALGMRTLMDYPSGLSRKMHFRFVQSVMIGYSLVLRLYIRLDDLPWNYEIYLRELFDCCYKYFLPFHKRLLGRIIVPLLCTRKGHYLAHRVLSMRENKS